MHRIEFGQPCHVPASAASGALWVTTTRLASASRPS